MAILSIDQGGTKTASIISDEYGTILGKGIGFGACHFFDGVPRAMEAVLYSAEKAILQAGIGKEDVKCISAGMAGANWEDEVLLLEGALKKEFRTGDVKVYNDCLIALRAGTDSHCAGIICAGTGMNVAIYSNENTVILYNNYIEDSDQGGSGLGGRAVRALFLSEMGILPPTGLKDKILKYFEVSNIEGLMRYYRVRQEKKPAKELCGMIFESADEGDGVALKIINEFGISASRYITSGIKKYGLQDREVKIVISGGVFKAANNLLFETISNEIKDVAPKASIINALYEPVVGAMLLALDIKHHGKLAEDITANCHKSASALGLLRKITEYDGIS